MLALGLRSEAEPKCVRGTGLRLSRDHGKTSLPAGRQLFNSRGPRRNGDLGPEESKPRYLPQNFVNFDQTNAGASAIAAQNSGVVIRIKEGYDGRFRRIGRSKTGRLDKRFLRVLPVVIGCNSNAVFVHQLKRRVGQCPRDVKRWLSQSWSEPADNNFDAA